MLFDMTASLRARDLQPWEGFGSSFPHPWLDPSSPMTDFALSNRCEKVRAIARR